MSIMTVHLAKGSANRKLTGLEPTPAGNARRDSSIWVINPVAIGADMDHEPHTGRTYSLCDSECIHLPKRFGGTADQDCYADGPILWTADRIDGIDSSECIREVREGIAEGKCRAIRWAVIGDTGRTPTQRAIARTFLRALRSVAEPAGVPIISYTHGWKGERGHSVAANASCDTLEEVEEAKALGYQPVYVAQDHAEAREAIDSVDGRGFVCPEMDGRASGCFGGDSPCGKGTPLCSIDRKQSLMVLLAH